MTLFCSWWRGRLARQAARGEMLPPHGGLARHVEHCPACREEWTALRRLAGELECLPAAPAVPADFTAVVMARIRALPAPHGVGVLLPAVACLSLVTVGSINGWGLRQASSKRAAQPISAPLALPLPEFRPAPRQLVEAPANAVPLRRVRRRERRRRGVLASRRVKEPTFPRVVPAPAPPDWSRFELKLPAPGDQTAALASLQAEAIRLEREGRFDGAARLYRRAHEEQPEPSAAFAAAQACERAGELPEAVDYYSKLLMRDPDSGSN